MSDHCKYIPASATVCTIGAVESCPDITMDRPDYEDKSTIRIFPQYEEALKGLEDFSHIFVIYHQHLAEEWMRARNWPDGTLRIPPPDPRSGMGIFTIRAPCRPARIGSCVVRLLGREGCLLHVQGLDAVQNTPILDIKVYVPAFDSVPIASIPSLWKAGMQTHYGAKGGRA